MFFPLSERYSTSACAPMVSLPSTFVLSSTRNSTAGAPCLPFATLTVNAASPTDAICPDTDWFSGARLSPSPAAFAGKGCANTARVKQAINSVANERIVRNLILSFSNLISTGTSERARNKPNSSKICRYPLTRAVSVSYAPFAAAAKTCLLVLDPCNSCSLVALLACPFLSTRSADGGQDRCTIHCRAYLTLPISAVVSSFAQVYACPNSWTRGVPAIRPISEKPHV